MKHTKNTVAIALSLSFGSGLIASPVLAAGQKISNDVIGMTTKLLGHAPEVTNVYEIEKQRLNRGRSKFQPWSGSYWPDINGGIATHYRDHGTFWSQARFVLRYDFAKNRLHRDHANVCDKYQKWDPSELNQKLSPAEKYDLLIGNTNFSFTQAILDELDFRDDHRMTARYSDGSQQEEGGDESTGSNPDGIFESVEAKSSSMLNEVDYRYWRKKGGSLAYWSGICDGWSPASIYLPRPVKPVTVTGALGHQLTFYPDDLKALGAYMFARSQTNYFHSMNYQMAGNACRDAKRGLNLNENGTIADPRCNDVDAGLFHLTLVNRIGKDRLGFVMDFDNNLKINNHPVYSYSMEYFSPSNGETGSLKNMMVDIKTAGDPFSNPNDKDMKNRRDPRTKYLVGVRTTIKYMFYVWPEGNRDLIYDHPSNDELKEKTYVYDLEIDADGNILGGEWGDRSSENTEYVSYSINDQPDFIWMAGTNDLPYSEMSFSAFPGLKKDMSKNRPFGNMNWSWDGKSPMPSEWIEAARADATYQPPLVAKDPENVKREERNSQMKSPQMLSHIVYYLFDQARSAKHD